jgi:hypothetical protein
MTDQLMNPSKKNVLKYVPSEEKPQHKAMFSFYSSLGKKRSISQVAKEFGLSKSFVGTLSRAFQWQERIRRSEEIADDPVIKSVEVKVTDSRKRLVDVVHDIIDTLHELFTIAAVIKRDNRVPDDKEQARIDTLQVCLRFYGFESKSPKDIRDLVSILKEIMGFGKTTVPPKTGDIKIEGDVNIEQSLTIKDLD